MHTFLKRRLRAHPGQPVRRARVLRPALVHLLGVCLALMPVAPLTASSSTAPQVLIAITNSSSMDGTTAGAIYVGSGTVSDKAFWNSTTSPANYTIPTGFTPPIANNGNGTAPYTSPCPGSSSYACDNGPSRLNIAKAAIASIVGSYGNLVNFGLYDYSTAGSTVSLYNTWVYYMSPPSTFNGGAFAFSNSATSSAAGTVNVLNPCNGYNKLSNGSTPRSNCQAVARGLGSTIQSAAYMTISVSSDDPLINDVLYAPPALNLPENFVAYSGPTPFNPYTAYSLADYNTGLVQEAYASTAPQALTGAWALGPTNAGYVPYSAQVMFSSRGFGYSTTAVADGGNLVAAMGSAPGGSLLNSALAPETNNPLSSEIKSVASQSPVGGLIKGALAYLKSLTVSSCQSQYVVLVTDGQPTLDLAGLAWPPLGTAAATGYGAYAAYNADGSLNVSGTNHQALKDAVSQIAALKTAGIKTYVIGLGAGVDSSVNVAAAQALTAMAIAGGTSTFFPATSQSALSTAFSGILGQITAPTAVSAPVGPLSVAAGNGYEYLPVSQPTPSYGTVSAYATSSGGATASTPSWEAGALMSASTRAAALYSTGVDGSSISLLSALDAAAFNLSATNCITNTATIVNYTADPSYAGVSGCSFLAGRASGTFLGTFSAQNGARYVGPPNNSQLVSDSSYVSYATGLNSRKPLLMFSNNDGFLYALNAQTGALAWGWMPRSLVAQLQYFSVFQGNQHMNGGFAVVDAKDTSAPWGSYVVGSAQGGAEHYVLRLNSSGAPAAQVYDLKVSGGSSPGDAAVASTGTAPLRQSPQIAWINGSAYALFVVNAAGHSTLYEVNVATGGATTAALSPVVSSALSYAAATGSLYFGSSSGGIWSLPISGNAATDAGLIMQIGTTVNPTSVTNPVSNVLYVGYTEIRGIPYVYALNPAQLTVFGVGSGGWTPLWAATPSAGYAYSSGSFSSSTTVNTLQSGALVSDAPLVTSGALVVPEWVAASGGSCGAGNGYYSFFNLAQGKFPTGVFGWNGSAVTSALAVGSGAAYTPNAVVTNTGVSLNVGSAGDLKPAGSLALNVVNRATVSGWRVIN